MKKLLPYIKPYCKYVICAAVFLCIEVAAEVSIPKIMTLAVKTGVDAQSTKWVLVYGGLMMVLSLIGCIGGLFGLRFAAKASTKSTGEIRKAMFAKIQRLPLDAFDSASLTLRLGFDVNQLQSLLQMFFRILIRAPLLFAGAIIMATTISSRLVLVFWAISVIACIVVVLITKKSYRQFSVAQKKLEKVNRIIKEDITAVKDIRAFNLEESENQKFGLAADEYKTENTKALKVLSLTSPISTMIVNLSAVPILWFGKGLISPTFAVEDIIAYTTYIGQVLLAFMMISMVLMLYAKAQVSINRINEVLDSPELADTSKAGAISKSVEAALINNSEHSLYDSAENLAAMPLEFDSVSFKYSAGSGKPVLDKLSFYVEPGSYTAIIGSTGSGKSTIAALASRMMKPSDGQILLGGRDIFDYSEEELRRLIIPVYQSGELLSGTLASNISSGVASSDVEPQDAAAYLELRAAAKKAQFLEFIESNEEGFNYEVSAKASNLSGGQKQRLALARAFFKHGRLYIFDDCISAVNPSIRKKIMGEIKAMKGVTRIVLTQRPDEIKDADNILLLEQGRIAASGTHDELYASCSSYRYFFDNGGEING